ncbi:response regulator [Salibacteraceae bacterium]|jgi:two-component system, chemotaxis family, chemotaxis protein CheY|nr:response regulator [Salibacteraceae bacterium]
MSKRIISIIDDDSICRMVVRKQIECSEYKTETNEFDNGFPAFEFLMSNMSQPEVLPDVIFLDIFMPNMNGWQFLEKLEPFSRTIVKAPQIYVLSTSLDVNDIERAEDHPLVTGFIPKPIKLRQIQRIIHKVKFYGLTG